MRSKEIEKLASLKTFTQLIAYLRDEMGWPIAKDSFEEVDDLFFDYSADELGIDPQTAVKIEEIKRLRPLSPQQPWGIFFVKFAPKRLPVVALRRILGQVALKKRASANKSERTAWSADDLLFVSNYGSGDERQISFAHFSVPPDGHDLPTLKVLGWDDRDTVLHLDAVAKELTEHLAWPGNESDTNGWREQWRAAFTVGHREAITTSKELAKELAGLARRIRDRIKSALALETDKGPLTKLMTAFQQSLVHDLDADAFADMYAQTIAYGLLSARIADPRKRTADDFAAHMRTSPFLRELMQTFLKIGGRRGKAGGPGIDFDELGVSEVVELLDAANMEAVVRDFGDRNPQEDPVIHFYEHFLSAYNKQLKIQRGVFYTPQPVVSYIVRCVHELLQTEFGLADGLADTTTWGEMLKKHPSLTLPPLTDQSGEKRTISPNEPFVQILDPATGTATFLVEVIDVIHRTLKSKWKQQRLNDAQQRAAWNDYVPEHLLPRLHAFELMMAPYAIAHMKLGLKLAETGYGFATEERARIYLTNALEPWVKQLPLIGFDALAHEAAAVNEIKRHKRFTVVIGNPPYSKSSQNQGDWIDGIMEEYKRTVRAAETQIQALSDDYAKFFRLAHFTLESSQLGILGYITNNGWLDGPLFRDMRSSVTSYFQRIRLLNLHGDSRKQFLPPDGKADENVFDIQQGVAVSVFSRNHLPHPPRAVGYAELWGDRIERYDALSHAATLNTGFASLEPTPPFYLFIPVAKELEAEFNRGWHLYDVFGTGSQEADNHESYGAGFVTQQDRFAIGHSKDEVVANVAAFLNPATKDDALWERFGFCSTDQWDFKRAKRELKGLDIRSLTRRCLYRPFDFRFTVFDRNICTIIRKRITSQFEHKNIGLLTTRRVTRLPYNNVFISNTFAEYKVASHDRNTIVFPLWIHSDVEAKGPGLFKEQRRLNFNPRFLHALATAVATKATDAYGLPADLMPEDIFHYAYAVFHSPIFRTRYAEFLKIDFPRLPLTGDLELFRLLARLGGELAALHLLESPRLEQSITALIGGRNPEVEKVSWSRDTVWVDKAQTIGFRGVLEPVWSFHIGGYQVCEKWLKDRKGRTLTKVDIAHYAKIVVALSETIRLMKEIDALIEQHGGWPAAFQGPGTT